MKGYIRFINSIKLQIIIIFVLCSGFTFCGSHEDKDDLAPGGENNVGVILHESAQLKVDPVGFSATFAMLEKGKEVKILEKSKEKSWDGKSNDYWYKVRLSKGIEGWVCKKDIRIFKGKQKTAIDSYMNDFWEEEGSRLKRELVGRWWSVDKFGNFTEHCIELEDTGKYKSYQKGGTPISGDFNFNYNNKEIIFLNGTSFGKNLKYVKRGMIYFLENKTEDFEIKFKKISDL